MQASLMRTQQPLTPFVLLAVLVHVLVILLLKQMPVKPTQPPPAFDVQLVRMPSQQTVITPTLIEEKLVAKTPSQPTKTVQKKPLQTTAKLVTNAPQSSAIFADSEPDKEIQAIENKPEKPKISAQALLATAHAIIRDEVKNMSNEKGENVALTDRAFSPALANALEPRQKPAAGITQYAGGMVKVVSANGNEYCLQQSPMLNKSAFESDPIPMTCP